MDYSHIEVNKAVVLNLVGDTEPHQFYMHIHRNPSGMAYELKLLVVCNCIILNVYYCSRFLHMTAQPNCMSLTDHIAYNNHSGLQTTSHLTMRIMQSKCELEDLTQCQSIQSDFHCQQVY